MKLLQCTIFVIILLKEIIELHGVYKPTRTRYRSWIPKSRKSYHPSFRPRYTSFDKDDKPYHIVIELPRMYDEFYDNIHRFNRAKDLISDSIEDYDRDEEPNQVFHFGDKKVWIKIEKGQAPKLHIRISRMDEKVDKDVNDLS